MPKSARFDVSVAIKCLNWENGTNVLHMVWGMMVNVRTWQQTSNQPGPMWSCQESSMAVRLWTSGWDFFAPTKACQKHGAVGLFLGGEVLKGVVASCIVLHSVSEVDRSRWLS